MGGQSKAEPSSNIENRLRELRTVKGMSQASLAGLANVTRQAICAIEANQYLPTTAVALRLAGALHCRVEDIFSLVSTGATIEGDLVGSAGIALNAASRTRVKVAVVGDRTVVRPVAALGEVLNYTVPADGLIAEAMHGERRKRSDRVTVHLLRDRRAIEQEIAVAGCDPAVFLIGDYLRRRKDATTVVGWTMGSAAAVEALNRGEVHMAGVHIIDPKSGEANLPYLRRHLKNSEVSVVTFATWEEGFLVRPGNPKSIRTVADLVKATVTLVNRETGSGARLLLDQRLREVGINATSVRGYDRIVPSHLEVARTIAAHQADVGIGIRSAAQLFALDFVPLQAARYDLVVPTAHLKSHPTLANLFEAMVSRPFRKEIEALGGYDTRDIGTVRSLRGVKVSGQVQR